MKLKRPKKLNWIGMVGLFGIIANVPVSCSRQHVQSTNNQGKSSTQEANTKTGEGVSGRPQNEGGGGGAAIQTGSSSTADASKMPSWTGTSSNVAIQANAQPTLQASAQGGLSSSAKTWGVKEVKEGEIILVPKGSTVVVDQPLPRLGGIRVEGTLRFAEADHELRLGFITVAGGTFEAGTGGCSG